MPVTTQKTRYQSPSPCCSRLPRMSERICAVAVVMDCRKSILAKRCKIVSCPQAAATGRAQPDFWNEPACRGSRMKYWFAFVGALYVVWLVLAFGFGYWNQV